MHTVPPLEHIGLDLHKLHSQLCILVGVDRVIERRIRTAPAAFAELLRGRPRARVLLESSTESEWVARCVEAVGHEVVVADPTFAPMYATRSRQVKTDKRDARALADACRAGTFRPAHRPSEARRHLRAALVVREALVRTRTRSVNLARAMTRREGLRLPPGARTVSHSASPRSRCRRRSGRSWRRSARCSRRWSARSPRPTSARRSSRPPTR